MIIILIFYVAVLHIIFIYHYNKLRFTYNKYGNLITIYDVKNAFVIKK
jgi:hypothetical protein